jgi:type II secretory pathway predicted ATPase ExeA
VWLNYWKIVHDPFLDSASAFVPTTMHAEAVARLVHTIEASERFAEVRSAKGLGKSRVLTEALRESRRPSRRMARVVNPVDGRDLFADLARGLGARIAPSRGRNEAWRTLVEAVRLCRYQRLGVVLAVDGSEHLGESNDRLDLERLAHIDPHPSARVTVLRVRATSGDDEPALSGSLRILLRPLTRSEVERFVVAKLAAAGRAEETFTPRALNRLEYRSEGIPADVDRLASLSMIAAAFRGLEIVTPEVVDGVAEEHQPLPVFN